MYKKILGLATLLITILAFGACQNTPEALPEEESLLTQNPTVEDGYLAVDTQDGMILHAWNWSMNTITDHLEDIAIAGFSTIQISPMQPQKDYFGVASWGGNWWKLYQPLGFSIATDNHAIGTLSNLESLTAAADEYGIKIIVDVVANHLAGGTSESLNENVEPYEPKIYEQKLYHTGYGYVTDSSAEAVIKGHMGGFPDLMTENVIVKDRVLSLLKAYVDAGVDGFRFDAAKHIETPEDGTLASDYWPTVIDGVRSYTENDLYIYGEILNTAGQGRSYTDYTPHMNVTTNTVSDAFRNGVISDDAQMLASIEYLEGVAANQSVLWAESHDDYAGEHTHMLDQSLINKTYAIQASRKDATSLYFARPSTSALMGEVTTYAWGSQEISESNRFHNYFAQASENVFASDDYFVNERYSENEQGLMLVNINGEATVSDLAVSHLPDGVYKDQITHTDFTVEDGLLSGEIGEEEIAVIYNNPYEPKPAIYVSDDYERGAFSDSKTITLNAYNTTEATYSLNGEAPIEFSGETSIKLTYPDPNGTVTLDVEAAYNDYTISETFTYEKTNIQVDEVTVNHLETTPLKNKSVAAWVWPEGGDGQWVEGTLGDDVFTFNLPDGHTWFLLVTFPKGASNFNWDDALEQTGDFQVPNDGNFDGADLNWQ
jgi:alpha-amylase